MAGKVLSISPEQGDKKAVSTMMLELYKHHVHSYQHCIRASLVVRQLALGCEMSRQEAAWITLASQLHDIGNVKINTDYLNNNEPIYVWMHAENGFFILQRKKGLAFSIASEIALAHHERWDGAGYPYGLARRKIPFYARLIAVADEYDNLRSSGITHESVVNYISAQSEAAFDPDVVNALKIRSTQIQGIWAK